MRWHQETTRFLRPEERLAAELHASHLRLNANCRPRNHGDIKSEISEGDPVMKWLLEEVGFPVLWER